jgi:hypothetical protein
MSEDKKDSIYRREPDAGADSEGHLPLKRGAPEEEIERDVEKLPASDESVGWKDPDQVVTDTAGHGVKWREPEDATRPGRATEDAADTEGHMPRSYRGGGRAPEGAIERDDAPAGPDEAVRRDVADGAVVDGKDTEGHRRKFHGPEDVAGDTESPTEPDSIRRQ